MSWYLTWQDPAALLLAAGGLGFSLWLRARLPSGCAACPKAAPPKSGRSSPSPPSGLGGQRIIPVSQLLRKLR